ncbi:inactive transglutaminase family protein [Litorivivens sp.]|uniref:inactive transglutaminase family protein n=1 Tax=Litorivivens sp. TaxID=2020868 RepID=UPI0035645560
MRDLKLRILAAILFAVGLGLCIYKVNVFGLPLKPGQDEEVWTVQARIAFKGTGKPTKVQFAVPHQAPGFVTLDEDYISGNYGLAIENDRENRWANWAVRRANGPQTLYYRISIARDSNSNELTGPTPPFPQAPVYPEPYNSAIKAILDDVRNESADIATYTRELLLQLNADKPNENVALLRGRANNDEAWVYEISEVLKGSRIPNRILYGLELSETVNNAQLKPWIQVHNGRRWLSFNPLTGQPGLPENFLVWRIGEGPLVWVEGAGAAEVIFSAARNYREIVDIARKRAERMGSSLIDASLFNLPLETQNVYRILLMVPMGALLVVILRNVVGIRTFGTFMPVLIALAFRETQLLWGIILFTLMIAVGLSIRFYLDRLMLLLVPRLASVLIIVVIMMILISILTHYFGGTRAMSVALFPMVIMAMTIERMSIVWEELGAGDAMKEGAGSLFTAVLGYLLMTNDILVHMFFVFPELLLCMLAITLLFGRYTGYRLTELWRFRAALKFDPPEPKS